MSPNGTEVLRYDTHADGEPDEVVAPDVALTGDAALDIDGPVVAISANDSSGALSYRVSATDSGSGVARILWSADGSEFHPDSARGVLITGFGSPPIARVLARYDAR